MTLHVRKRNGKVEPFDFDKIITAVKAAFDEQGIEMTYPHLNVHFDKEFLESRKNG